VLHDTGVVKLDRGVAVAPVGAVDGSGGEVAAAESSGVIVNGLMVAGRAKLGFCAVTTRVGVELLVNLADSTVVESSRGEVILGNVEGLFVEDLAGLFGEGLSEVVVVNLDTGDVTLVSREDSSLALNGCLMKKLVGVDLPSSSYRW
jgi:hypothetical protein